MTLMETTMLTRRQLLSLAAFSIASPPFGLSRIASAQIGMVKLVVGFQAGGGFDSITRIVAEQLRTHLQETVIVENKPGAAGRLAVDAVKNAAADGSMLLVTPSPVLTLAPHTAAGARFDPMHDLVTVARLASFDYGFAVSAATNITTLEQYIDAVRKDESLGAYGTPGVGLTPHFVGMILGRETGLELLHVAYKGTAPALQDAMGNQVPAVCATAPSLVAGHKSGRIRVLATTGATRNPDLPDVPTFAEAGINNLTIEDWAVLSAPSGTPAALVDKLNQAVMALLADPKLQQQFKQQGFYPAGLSALAATSLLKSDYDNWETIVKSVGFKGAE
jgi:tripartite-type tricarboxylate transporter receptor subunit TctC